MLQCCATATEQSIQRRATQPHHCGKQQAKHYRNHCRAQRQPRRARRIACTHCACNGGRDAAAHRASGHHLHQNYNREHQRNTGKPFRTQPADKPRIRKTHQRLHQRKHYIGRSKTDQRWQNGRGQQTCSALCGCCGGHIRRSLYVIAMRGRDYVRILLSA